MIMPRWDGHAKPMPRNEQPDALPLSQHHKTITSCAMTDPFSIIAGVLGIATAAIRSSKALIELVDDIRGGPEEIKAVSRDVHAFYSIIIALNATLKDDSIRDVVSGDVAMMDMIRN